MLFDLDVSILYPLLYHTALAVEIHFEKSTKSIPQNDRGYFLWKHVFAQTHTVRRKIASRREVITLLCVPMYLRETMGRIFMLFKHT